MENYILRLWDSKNTCFTESLKVINYFLAKEKAIQLSRAYKKITLENKKGAFEEFENGEMTSWSYPNGLGQIKINS